MPLKKRGLGRGLEALLTDVLVKVEREEDVGIDPALDAEAFQGQTASLTQDSDLGLKLQDARRDLLEEAEALRTLIEDLERNLRAE